MLLTPIVVFDDVLKTGVPRIDRELLAAGNRIRDLEGTRIPVVLADPDAGAVLAGLFGERVYAGHWSLTPGFMGKSDQLGKAGLGTSGSSRSGYDGARLARLLHESKADYILVESAAPAAQAIAACSRSKPIFEGERWIAVSTAGWSCP